MKERKKKNWNLIQLYIDKPVAGLLPKLSRI